MSSFFDDSARDIDKLDEYKPGLAAYFRENILSQQTKLEGIRLEKLALIKKRKPIAILLTLIAVVICIPIVIYLSNTFPDSDIFGLPIGLTFFIALISYSWTCGPAEEYRKIIKEEVFGEIVKSLGEKFSFNRRGGIRSKIEESDIIPKYDSWESDDIICGEHEGVSIEIEECKLTYESGSGKNRRTVTSFRGIMVLLSMNKNFNGKTVVKSDAGGVGNWLSDKFSDKETVHLEDPQFEKMFQVYATDQVEARYLLTTAFMERLIKLRESFSAGGMEIFNAVSVQINF